MHKLPNSSFFDAKFGLPPCRNFNFCLWLCSINSIHSRVLLGNSYSHRRQTLANTNGCGIVRIVNICSLRSVAGLFRVLITLFFIPMEFCSRLFSASLHVHHRWLGRREARNYVGSAAYYLCQFLALCFGCMLWIKAALWLAIHPFAVSICLNATQTDWQKATNSCFHASESLSPIWPPSKVA